MPMETSRPSTVAQRLLQQSNFIPKATKSTPTTSKQINDSYTTQVGPTEHLTWEHENLPKSRVPHSQFILTHYTTPCGLHPAFHPVPHHVW